MQRKYQVFASSTYSDLVEERQDTLKSILDLGHIPSGMEGFFAADQDQFEYIKKIIDECDYYILIIAGRYGSVDENGISYTEREYDYAVSKGITVLAFIHNDTASLPAGRVDTEPSLIERLRLFKEKVSQKRLVSCWNNREQLKANIIISLSKAIADVPGIGWARGNIVANEDVLSQLNEFRNEVDLLRQENEQLKAQMQPNVDDIASLNEAFAIRYTYINKRTYQINDRIILSWADILKAIGSSFFSPKQQAAIELCIKRQIVEGRGGNWPQDLHIYESDIQVIKIQMAAYGFMTIYSAQVVNGGLEEFMQLTDFGKRTLVETAAVKSSHATS